MSEGERKKRKLSGAQNRRKKQEKEENVKKVTSSIERFLQPGKWFCTRLSKTIMAATHRRTAPG